MSKKGLYRVLIRMKSGEDYSHTAVAVYMDKFHIMVTLAGDYNPEDVLTYDRESVSGCWMWPI